MPQVTMLLRWRRASPGLVPDASCQDDDLGVPDKKPEATNKNPQRDLSRRLDQRRSRHRGCHYGSFGQDDAGLLTCAGERQDKTAKESLFLPSGGQDEENQVKITHHNTVRDTEADFPGDMGDVLPRGIGAGEEKRGGARRA